MSTLSSIRFSPVVSQNVHPSNSGTSTPAQKVPQTPTGFSNESSFDAAPTGKSAKSTASGRTGQQALKEMNEVLDPAKNWTRKENGSTVTADAPNVDDAMNSSSAKKEATAQLKANQKLEQKHLAGMSEKDQAKYKAVKEALQKDSNPVGELALQKLLFQGKLPGSKDLAGQGTVLGHLASVAKGDNLHKDVRKNHKSFLNGLVQELATPSAINQGERGTCAPTAMSIDLALKHPAEYARIVKGLASPEGKVKLADGKTTLQREPETSFSPDGSGRAITQRLLAPAFMEIANGNRNYNDRTSSGDGAYASDLDTLQDKVYGRNMEYDNLSSKQDRADAMKRIDRELASGQNVLAGIQWDGPDSGHKVLVTRSDDKYIHFINPWGKEEKMPREQFEKRLRNINYDPSGTKKSAPAVPQSPAAPPEPVSPPRPKVTPKAGNTGGFPFNIGIDPRRFMIIPG